MTPLGIYLRDQLHSRDLSPEEFGRRSGMGTSHVYQIIRGQKPNVRQSTLAKIALGLNMSLSELLAAIAVANEADPVEAAIRTRTAEMREAVRDTPREFWATIIKATFDRAIGGARDMARLLAEADTASASNSGHIEPGAKAPDAAPIRPQHNVDGGIAGPHRHALQLVGAH